MDTFYIVVLPMLLEGEALPTGSRHQFPGIEQSRIDTWLAKSMVIVDPNQEPNPVPPAEPDPEPDPAPEE